MRVSVGDEVTVSVAMLVGVNVMVSVGTMVLVEEGDGVDDIAGMKLGDGVMVNVGVCDGNHNVWVKVGEIVNEGVKVTAGVRVGTFGTIKKFPT